MLMDEKLLIQNKDLFINSKYSLCKKRSCIAFKYRTYHTTLSDKICPRKKNLWLNQEYISLCLHAIIP